MDTYSGLYLSDILAETNLKPWWETLRSYCVAAMILAALFILYQDQGAGDIACVPANVNETVSGERTNFIQGICFGTLPRLERNFGAVGLCATILFYFWCMWWQMAPYVRDRFTNVRKEDRIIGELHLQPDKVVSLATNPYSNPSLSHRGTDKDPTITRNSTMTAVRKVCRTLWTQRNSKYAYTNRITLFYSSTTIVALVSISIAMYLCVNYIYEQNRKAEETFACNAGDIAVQTTGIRKYICTNDAPSQIYSTVILYTISLTGQVVFNFISFLFLITMWIYSRKREYRHVKLDNLLIVTFSEHAEKLNQATKQLLLFNCDILKTKIKKAMELEDFGFIDLLLCIEDTEKRKKGNVGTAKQVYGMLNKFEFDQEKREKLLKLLSRHGYTRQETKAGDAQSLQECSVSFERNESRTCACGCQRMCNHPEDVEINITRMTDEETNIGHPLPGCSVSFERNDVRTCGCECQRTSIHPEDVKMNLTRMTNEETKCNHLASKDSTQTNTIRQIIHKRNELPDTFFNECETDS